LDSSWLLGDRFVGIEAFIDDHNVTLICGNRMSAP
jgi:hypothetical protein